MNTTHKRPTRSIGEIFNRNPNAEIIVSRGNTLVDHRIFHNADQLSVFVLDNRRLQNWWWRVMRLACRSWRIRLALCRIGLIMAGENP